jgi:hypothetical protein
MQQSLKKAAEIKAVVYCGSQWDRIAVTVSLLIKGLRQNLGGAIAAVSLNISPKKKTKAALRGIKVVPTNSYAQGEERPYGNTVYTRTDGISATGTARGGRAI